MMPNANTRERKKKRKFKIILNKFQAASIWINKDNIDDNIDDGVVVVAIDDNLFPSLNHC